MQTTTKGPTKSMIKWIMTLIKTVRLKVFIVSAALEHSNFNKNSLLLEIRIQMEIITLYGDGAKTLKHGDK